MELKYNPESLLFRTALIFEFDGKMAASLTDHDPALKKYVILIEIMNSNEWFRINMDYKFNYLLSRGSRKEWRLQNPDELDKNENQLGRVIVKKESKTRKEYHKFDLFWNEVKREEEGG